MREKKANRVTRVFVEFSSNLVYLCEAIKVRVSLTFLCLYFVFISFILFRGKR